MAWIALVMAGLFEMMGVYMISRYNRQKNMQNLFLLIVAFTFSFSGLTMQWKLYQWGQLMQFGQGSGRQVELYLVCCFSMNRRIGAVSYVLGLCLVRRSV